MLRRIQKRFKFDWAHRITTQKLHGLAEEKCRNLHGHTSYCIMVVEAPSLDEYTHMVLDFTFLHHNVFKKTGCFHPQDLDHAVVLYKDDPICKLFIDKDAKCEKEYKYGEMAVKVYRCDKLDTKVIVTSFVPTAETLAEFLYHSVAHHLETLKTKFLTNGTGFKIAAVGFEETEGSIAWYRYDGVEWSSLGQEDDGYPD